MTIDYSHKVIESAKGYATCLEAVSAGVIGFIPNGIEQIYDRVLKRLPLLKRFFAHTWVEQVIRLCSGITIGQGLAGDIARFIFWPCGFCLGALFSMATGGRCVVPSGQAARIRLELYTLSGYTVGGALAGGIVGGMLAEWFWVGVGILLGSLIGMVVYGFYRVALIAVRSQQQHTMHSQRDMAKKMGASIKELARQIVKGRISVYAQDIIQQMNGPTAQSELIHFFENELESIVQLTNSKLDRHFGYLTERASYGDQQACDRLHAFLHQRNVLEALLNRLFNARTVAKIKDDIDSRYDRWHYQFLRTA